MPYFRVSLGDGHRHCQAEHMAAAVAKTVDGGDTCVHVGDNVWERPGNPGHRTRYRVAMISKAEYERATSSPSKYGSIWDPEAGI